MSIPPNIKKIKKAFSIEQVNAHLSEGWSLVAITQRGGSMGPLYTLGWIDATASSERNRQNAASRARGLVE